MCVAACPFGAMGFNPVSRGVYKCDFCDGDPQCARFCEVGAVQYVDVEKVAGEKQFAAAEKFNAVLQKATAALASVNQ